MGKSTLATTVYNLLKPQYPAHASYSFEFEYSDVNKGSAALLKQLGVDNADSKSSNEIKSLLVEKVQAGGVLLLLDNISPDHINPSKLPPELFNAQNSVILATSRDSPPPQLSDKNYSMKEMQEEDARQLFRYHTFGDPSTAFLGLGQVVVPHGVPRLRSTCPPLTVHINL